MKIIRDEKHTSQGDIRKAFGERHGCFLSPSALQRDMSAIGAYYSTQKKYYVLPEVSQSSSEFPFQSYVAPIQPILKVKLLRPDARMPTYGSDEASGMDVYLPQNVTLHPDVSAMIPLGIALEIPPGFEVQIRPRSSTNKQGIHCPLGTVDSDYRGEISVVLMSMVGVVFFKGERVCQLVLAPVARAEIIQAETLTETARGAGGFGSTGK